MKKNNFWKRFWNLNVHNHEGFTLVELIIVIAILAILSSVAVVGYSAYIKKANKAADDELLRQINQAFRSACLDNGCDVYDIETAAWDMTNMTVKSVNGKTNHPIVASFEKFFEVNDPEFKVIEGLKFENGMFVEGVDTYSALYEQLLAKYGDDISKLTNSSLGAFGAEGLLTEVADTLDWLGSNFDIAAMTGEPFAEAYLSYLGIDSSLVPGSDEFNAAYLEAVERLGGDEDAIFMNAVVLYAAQNSEELSTDSIGAWLGSDSAPEDFESNPNATTLSEAAAIYGLYMAYKGEDFDHEANTMDVVLEALTDEDFANWVKNDPAAEAELEAYKLAMGMVTDASEGDAVDSILANGFADPELIAMLERLMGN